MYIYCNIEKFSCFFFVYSSIEKIDSSEIVDTTEASRGTLFMLTRPKL